jgi:nucleotide-binding universal stress UspA family protein
MTTILHPTRGGEASYPNQDRVIAIAKEQNARLIFLYVSDVQFLNRTASQVVLDVVAKEIDEMGDFVLAIAQERAKKAGLSAEAIVRRGVFSDVLIEVITEYEVDTLILGSSPEGQGLTTPEFLAELSSEINAETGVSVVILSKGEIANTLKQRT